MYRKRLWTLWEEVTQVSTWGLSCTFAMLGVRIYKLVKVPLLRVPFPSRLLLIRPHLPGRFPKAPAPGRVPRVIPSTVLMTPMFTPSRTLLASLMPSSVCGDVWMPRDTSHTTNRKPNSLFSYLHWHVCSPFFLYDIPIHMTHRTVTDRGPQPETLSFFLSFVLMINWSLNHIDSAEEYGASGLTSSRHPRCQF